MCILNPVGRLGDCGWDVLSSWGYLAQLLPWLRRRGLVSALTSLKFLRTHGGRQGFISIAIKWGSRHSGEMPSLRVGVKLAAGKGAYGVPRAGSCWGTSAAEGLDEEAGGEKGCLWLSGAFS